MFWKMLLQTGRRPQHSHPQGKQEGRFLREGSPKGRISFSPGPASGLESLRAGWPWLLEGYLKAFPASSPAWPGMPSAVQGPDAEPHTTGRGTRGQEPGRHQGGHQDKDSGGRAADSVTWLSLGVWGKLERSAPGCVPSPAGGWASRSRAE